MAMTVEKTERVFLLGGEPHSRFRFHFPVTRLHTRKKIAEAMADAVNWSVVWIATKEEATDELLKEAFNPSFLHVSHHGRYVRRSLGRLLLLHTARPESIPALEGIFAPVAWGMASFKTLPPAELAEVLASEHRHDLVIGGFVDPGSETLTLYRGDFEKLSVPLSLFKPSGTGTAPTPSAFEVADCGQTLRLGQYEAATDAVLYEVDPEYRRQVTSKRHKEDRTFGACLRRLRKLRGLRQGDFEPIPAKTIARIERGQTQQPHGNTLQEIADRLGVDRDEIKTF